MAEQVTVDEEELKELQRPWHAAHVDVGLVKEPLEGRLGAWTKDSLGLQPVARRAAGWTHVTAVRWLSITRAARSVTRCN